MINLKEVFSYGGEWHDKKMDKLIDGLVAIGCGMYVISWSLTAALYVVGMSVYNAFSRWFSKQEK